MNVKPSKFMRVLIATIQTFLLVGEKVISNMIVHSSQPIRVEQSLTVGLRLVLNRMTISHILLIPQKRGSLAFKIQSISKANTPIN